MCKETSYFFSDIICYDNLKKKLVTLVQLIQGKLINNGLTLQNTPKM